jgi:hypothetical protein
MTKAALRRRASIRPARRGRPAARAALRPSQLPCNGRRKRRALRIALALALALALAWWLARPQPEPASPPEPEPASAPTSRPVRKAAKKIAKPPPPAPSLVDEARLRAALQQRAPDLRACSVPPGAPPQVPARLRVAADGKMRSVELTSPVPIPAPLASCLRERMSAWQFDDLRLQSEVAVLVTFALR